MKAINKLRTSIQALLIGGLFALVAVFPAQAATSSAPAQGITISPTSVDQTIDPGSSYTNYMLVLNQGQVGYSYKIYAAPFSVSGEDYQPDFSPLPGAPDITNWFQFNKTHGYVDPGGTNPIQYTVSVPKATKPGSYFGTIFAQTDDTATKGVVIHRRVGMVLYLRVAGQAVQSGSIQSWSVPWLQRYPLTATLRLANTGTVHYQANVNVTIADVFGSAKYKFNKTPEILPYKLRRIPVAWNKGGTFGLFKVSGTAQFLGKTYNLAPNYVLVASTLMRLVMLGTFLLLCGLIILVLGKKRVARKK